MIFFITSKLMLNLAEFPALTTMKLLILASVNRGLTMRKSKIYRLRFYFENKCIIKINLNVI